MAQTAAPWLVLVLVLVAADAESTTRVLGFQTAEDKSPHFSPAVELVSALLDATALSSFVRAEAEAFEDCAHCDCNCDCDAKADKDDGIFIVCSAVPVPVEDLASEYCC